MPPSSKVQELILSEERLYLELRMTHRFGIRAYLPNSVDLIKEQRLSCTLVEAFEKEV